VLAGSMDTLLLVWKPLYKEGSSFVVMETNLLRPSRKFVLYCGRLLYLWGEL